MEADLEYKRQLYDIKEETAMTAFGESIQYFVNNWVSHLDNISELRTGKHVLRAELQCKETLESTCFAESCLNGSSV